MAVQRPLLAAIVPQSGRAGADGKSPGHGFPASKPSSQQPARHRASQRPVSQQLPSHPIRSATHFQHSVAAQPSAQGNSKELGGDVGFSDRVGNCFILDVGGFVKIPGSEPIHLDLEKLFLLSLPKENLDFRGQIEKNLHSTR